MKRFIAFGLISIATGFSPCPTVRPNSALNLIPEQGVQLVAAWEAASTHLHDEHHQVTAAHAARTFAAHLFSLPATLLHPHPQEQIEKDVTYYPIVGFQFVADSPKPLPTMRRGIACRIPNTSEEVYGWFAPACRLSHPDSDDYGKEPLN
jgi:hypothetical protein